jgi:hypothetical protein
MKKLLLMGFILLFPLTMLAEPIGAVAEPIGAVAEPQEHRIS